MMLSSVLMCNARITILCSMARRAQFFSSLLIFLSLEYMEFNIDTRAILSVTTWIELLLSRSSSLEEEGGLYTLTSQKVIRRTVSVPHSSYMGIPYNSYLQNVQDPDYKIM